MKKWIVLAMLALSLTGCTLSLANFDTHGTATDLMQEDQAASPTVIPTLTIPAKAL